MEIKYYGCGLNNNNQLDLPTICTEDAEFCVKSAVELQHLHCIDLPDNSTAKFQDNIQISLSYISYRNNQGWKIFGHKAKYLEEVLPSVMQSAMVRISEKRVVYVNDANEIFVCASTGIKRVQLQYLKGLDEDTDDVRNPGLKDISVQDNCLLIIDEDGRLYNSGIEVFLPRLKISEVSTGKEHCLALTEMGEVLSWGSGMKGQLGNGEINKIENPEIVSSLAGLQIAHICCGGWHSIALSASGDAYVWGWNDVGQLGFPSNSLRSDGIKWDDIFLNTFSSKSPTKTDTCIDLTDPKGMINSDRTKEQVNVQATPKLLDYWKVEFPVKRVACGDRHSVFLLDNGSAWTTGWNLYGQLGVGSNESADEPRLVPLQNVVEIFAGGWNSIFAVNREK